MRADALKAASFLVLVITHKSKCQVTKQQLCPSVVR
jgi:hypothetical protein